MNPPRLIVNADDFGLSRGISEAVFAAHEHGILTSASMMANQPASQYAIELLREMPLLGIGVHLNLCSGKPVLPPHDIPTLVDSSGAFHTPNVLFRKLWRHQISIREIEAEFLAQIHWLRERGVAPVHADSHLHVHLYPVALRPFIKVLRGEGIRFVRTPRCSVWPPAGPGGAHAGSIARRLLVQSYRGALQFGPLRGFAMPHSRISFRATDRRDLAAIGRLWMSALDHLPSGTFELACHPGILEPGFSETDNIAAQREEELRWLTSASLKEAVDRNHVQLIRYVNTRDRSHQSHNAVEVHAA